MAPDYRVVPEIEEWAKETICTFENARATFVRDLHERPDHALRWSGAMFMRAAEHQVAQVVVGWATRWRSGLMSVQDMVEVAHRETITHAGTVSVSSAPPDNLYGGHLRAAWTRLYRRLTEEV